MIPLLFFLTLPTKVEDDRALKQRLKDIFQLSCVHVKICMNLASGGTTWCFSFHVLLTMLEVQDSAALAANGGDRFVCWCEKSSPQKTKGGGGGTDVRRVCGHLVSVGFSAACDVCGAKISPFDGLCACRLTLNQLL